jgi:transposase
VSRPTFYKAQADFERAGLVGLLPAKRGPHAGHKITAKVLAFIEELRAAEPELDAPALIERIAERFGLSVHRRTVERALARRKKKRP